MLVRAQGRGKALLGFPGLLTARTPGFPFGLKQAQRAAQGQGLSPAGPGLEEGIGPGVPFGQGPAGIPPPGLLPFGLGAPKPSKGEHRFLRSGIDRQGAVEGLPGGGEIRLRGPGPGGLPPGGGGPEFPQAVPGVAILGIEGQGLGQDGLARPHLGAGIRPRCNGPFHPDRAAMTGIGE